MKSSWDLYEDSKRGPIVEYQGSMIEEIGGTCDPSIKHEAIVLFVFFYDRSISNKFSVIFNHLRASFDSEIFHGMLASFRIHATTHWHTSLYTSWSVHHHVPIVQLNLFRILLKT